MQHVDTYEQDRARRARIQAEYEAKVKGQLFTVGNGYDTHTGGSTPADKQMGRPVVQSYRFNFR